MMDAQDLNQGNVVTNDLNTLNNLNNLGGGGGNNNNNTNNGGGGSGVGVGGGNGNGGRKNFNNNRNFGGNNQVSDVLFYQSHWNQLENNIWYTSDKQ